MVKILLLDIETAPITAHVWGLRDQNIGLNQIRSHPRVIGLGAKWLDKGGVKWWSEYHHDRTTMLTGIRDMLGEADVAVHYNGNLFDIPWLYTEWAKEGIDFPEPFKNIDLYRAARKLRLPSYKLEYVAQFFGLGGKLQHAGHQMWVDCLEGEGDVQRKAWNDMRRYCIRDVHLLNPLFYKLAQFFPNTVNMGLYGDFTTRKCPKCPAPPGTLRRKGVAYTANRAYPQYRCLPEKGGCGGWSRDTKGSWGIDITGVAR